MTSPVGLLELCKCIKDIMCADERAQKPESWNLATYLFKEFLAPLSITKTKQMRLRHKNGRFGGYSFPLVDVSWKSLCQGWHFSI